MDTKANSFFYHSEYIPNDFIVPNFLASMLLHNLQSSPYISNNFEIRKKL